MPIKIELVKKMTSSINPINNQPSVSATAIDERPFPFSQLPAEIMQIICEFLPPSDLSNASLAIREVKVITADNNYFWRRLIERDFGKEKVKQVQNLKNIPSNFYKENYIEEYLKIKKIVCFCVSFLYKLKPTKEDISKRIYGIISIKQF